MRNAERQNPVPDWLFLGEGRGGRRRRNNSDGAALRGGAALLTTRVRLPIVRAVNGLTLICGICREIIR